VGEDAAAGVVADAQDLRTGAHLPVRRVVEDVALEGARSLQGEPGGLEAVDEAWNVFYAEFDLGFDGHG